MDSQRGGCREILRERRQLAVGDERWCGWIQLWPLDDRDLARWRVTAGGVRVTLVFPLVVNRDFDIRGSDLSWFVR